MSSLIASDLHLTDRDRDEYRWRLFPWIKEQIGPLGVTTLLFLGDTTDSKDKHSAKLTNRIVDTFSELSKSVEHTYILRGNHDYINEATPFFRFLNHIRGLEFVVSEWRDIYLPHRKVAVLVPNTKDFANVVAKIDYEWDYLFCHQTFKGATSESGIELDGLDPHMFDEHKGQVISGDVHVPHKLNDKILYVGAPYPIHFGDRFSPRLLLITNDGEIQSLPFETIKKHTIEITKPEQLKKVKLQHGDQVKVRLSLEDAVDWEEYKGEVIQFCTKHKVDLQQIEFMRQATMSLQTSKVKDLTPRELFQTYCSHSAIGEETQHFGERIIEEQINGRTTD